MNYYRYIKSVKKFSKVFKTPKDLIKYIEKSKELTNDIDCVRFAYLFHKYFPECIIYRCSKKYGNDYHYIIEYKGDYYQKFGNGLIQVTNRVDAIRYYNKCEEVNVLSDDSVDSVFIGKDLNASKLEDELRRYKI